MAGPTASEKVKLEEFRKRVAGALANEDQKEDSFLLRWIRAREGDLDKAEDMLRKSLEWRKETDMDSVLSWKPPPEVPQLAYFIDLGIDDDNRPVLWFPIGRWSLRQIADGGLAKDVIKYYFGTVERALNKVKGKTTRKGDPVTTVVLLDDVSGLSFRTLTNLKVIDFILQAMRVLEANYPETIENIHVINAGRAFSYLYGVLRPLMSERTAEKLTIYGTAEAKWKEAVHAAIPKSILPAEYGGENSITVSSVEPVVEDEIEPEAAPPEAQKLLISVPAQGKLVLRFTLEAGQTASWSFKTEKYDIAFAVVCSGKAFIEKKRVNSHESDQEGSTDQPGDYVFTFDNSYSRLRSKALHYNVEVKGPSGTKQIEME